MKTFCQIVVLATAVYFLSWFWVYKSGINPLAIQSEDTIPAVFLPVTLIKHQTLYADPYYQMILDRYPHPDDKEQTKMLTPFYFRRIPAASKTLKTQFPTVVSANNQVLSMYLKDTSENYHYISAFPIMSGLLAVPVYVVPLVMGMVVTWENLFLLSHLASALIVAFAGGFFYLLLKRQFQLGEKLAVLLTAVYLFATINYALISQALWQHGTVQLFLIIGLSFLLKFTAKSTEKNSLAALYLSGLFFGLAVLSRPTAALVFPFMFLLIYQALAHSPRIFVKSCIIFTLGLVPVLVFFAFYNQAFYHTVANQGYANQIFVSWKSNIFEGFAGQLFSPSKGVFVYSPVLLFSFVSLWQVVRYRHWKEDAKYLVFAGVVVLHIAILSMWKHWYGGYSYGYRMVSDVLPFLVLLSVPYITSPLFIKTRLLFYGTVVFSILVQVHGIIFFDSIWHAAYDKGFEDTGWLWSVKNSEFAFNIRRILVKLSLLEKACPVCLPHELN